VRLSAFCGLEGELVVVWSLMFVLDVGSCTFERARLSTGHKGSSGHQFGFIHSFVNKCLLVRTQAEHIVMQSRTNM
jgi:hypothetical protein